MNPERTESARTIVLAVRCLAEQERTAYLESACQGDAELQAMVGQMLAAEAGVMEDSALTASLPGEPTKAAPARTIGISRESAQRIVGTRYRIERQATAGGMGYVFEATDSVLHRAVAIKILRESQQSQSPDVLPVAVRDRLLKEARAMAGLRHLNLCRVHEVTVEGEVPFLVMDWIDGIGLTQAWQGLDLKQRIGLFIKVVEAVAAAHDAGLVHGDLKPENILVDRTGEPIIVDFGLAQGYGDGEATRHPIGGTPGYAAPEQFVERSRVGPETDVYGLGAILYELLTGRHPFAGVPVEEVITLARSEDPPAPETYAPDAPWPLQRICLVALERDQDRRYFNAHAMLLDLRRYLRGETVAARPSMMTDRFAESVERQIGQVESWLRQGMVTHSEASGLMRTLRGLLRPDFHWILDSRRLTVSQVTMYLGGWLVLVALSMGMTLTSDAWGYLASDALASVPWVRYLTAVAVTIGLLSVGGVLQGREQRRIALGFQATACLCIPLACWLLLGETQWLGGSGKVDTTLAGSGMGQEWLYALAGVSPSPETGLMNWQLLAICGVWLVSSATLRRITNSSLFTPFAVLAGGLFLLSAWASAGLLGDDRSGFARLGGWMMAVGSLALLPGLRLNAREEAHAREVGLVRSRRRDSWSILVGSQLMVGVGLTLTALNRPDVYTFGLIGDPEDVTTWAVALMANGTVYLVFAHLLERRRTIVRSRLAGIWRWLIPSHLLGALLLLQLDAGGSLKVVWLAALVLVAAACCYCSVWKQWRPFLWSGLVYVAIAYGRSFAEVIDQLNDDTSALDQTRLWLVGTVLVAGLATMAIAIKLPHRAGSTD